MTLRPIAALLAAALLSSPPAARAAVDARALFLENCASCHGEDGKADTDLGAKYMAADFTSDAFRKEMTSEAKVRKAIAGGVADTKMKAWKGTLSDGEIDALARYVLSISRKK